MDENLSFSQRLGNCARIHWNGWFYVISPLVLLPLVFMEPLLENRTVFIMLLGFIWYVVDVMPQGVTAVLPIIFYPVLGVLSSNEICMAYSRDSQMVYMLSCYIAIAFTSSKLDRFLALRVLKAVGVNPARILQALMILTFVLSTLIPDACACSITMPMAKAILQILDEISVCKPTDESVVLKDDEKPYPSKVANALYIGVAYAANIGGMTNLWSSESGYEFLAMYDDILHNSNAAESIHLKYILTSLPTTISLLAFTIFYLQVIFLGLMRSEKHKISYNTESSMSSLDTIVNSEPQGGNMYTSIALSLMLFYVILLIMMRISDIGRDSDEIVFMKYSAYVMLICFFAFVCPNSCYFLNYFMCKKPAEYKPSPSILAWAPVGKLMPWIQFFVYGSSLAYGVVIQHSGIYRYFAEGLVESDSTVMRQLGFMGFSIILTMLGANHLVANAMLLLGAKSGMFTGEDPSLFTIPIVMACSLSFLLPVSSVSNSFASGWANLRSKDLILAGIAPTFVGYILIFIFISIANLATPLFNKPAFDMMENTF